MRMKITANICIVKHKRTVRTNQTCDMFETLENMKKTMHWCEAMQILQMQEKKKFISILSAFLVVMLYFDLFAHFAFVHSFENPKCVSSNKMRGNLI